MQENLSINFVLIIVVLAVILKMADGYKKGMTREIISLVSLIVLCVVVALIAKAVNSYFSGQFFNVFVMVFLLALVGIVHHLLGAAFFPAKLVTKLPLIRFVDKLLGIVFGAFEVILILWTVFTMVMMMDMGPIEQVIIDYTADSEILVWFYQHNFLAYGIERLLSEFHFIPLG